MARSISDLRARNRALAAAGVKTPPLKKCFWMRSPARTRKLVLPSSRCHIHSGLLSSTELSPAFDVAAVRLTLTSSIMNSASWAMKQNPALPSRGRIAYQLLGRPEKVEIGESKLPPYNMSSMKSMRLSELM